ncbi:MAG: flagellar motor protein MotB [Candidatus Margulisbacteria bacterium]|nr:flagellar motor protein MotB [Candidatus Margulisiibacteriota bacterium]
MSYKKKVHQEEGESPIGFVMFGDLMSQLLCFFILLYVFATISAAKSGGTDYTDMIAQMSRNFKQTMERKPITIQEPKKEEKSKLVEKVRQVLIDQKLEPFVDLIVEDKKIRLIFSQPVLFDIADATLKADFAKTLSPVADIIKGISNNIVVEGHTDNVPIHTEKYDSNWVLSFHRAYSVVNYLTQTKGIDPQRISVMGYGEYRPRFANDTQANRDMNRRIEVIILTDANFANPTPASK